MYNEITSEAYKLSYLYNILGTSFEDVMKALKTLREGGLPGKGNHENPGNITFINLNASIWNM